MSKVVFLDLGDTLVKISPEVYEYLAQAISSMSSSFISSEDLQRAIRDEWERRNGEDLGGVITEEAEQKYWCAFYRAVLERLNVKNPPQDLLNLFAQKSANPESFVCFDDIDVLNELRERGIKLGLISNAFPSAKYILDHLHLREWFDFLLLSFELPYAKPDPRIYEHALRSANITPQQALFVDDRAKFVQGAKEVGMEALLIDREHCYQSGPGRICHLAQLLRMV